MCVCVYVCVPAKACRDPGVSDHAIRNGSSFQSGAKVSYSCEAGYSLNGDSLITCQDTVWSARRPSCERRFTYVI